MKRIIISLLLLTTTIGASVQSKTPVDLLVPRLLSPEESKARDAVEKQESETAIAKLPVLIAKS